MRRVNGGHQVTRISGFWNTEGAVTSRHPEVRALLGEPRRMRLHVQAAHPSRRGPLGRPQDDGGVCGTHGAVLPSPFYSAGLAAGGGGAAEGGVPLAAFVAAAFFSTMATAMIEPSYSANSGNASEAWLMTSGGVSTAAMMKAITMK